MQLGEATVAGGGAGGAAADRGDLRRGREAQSRSLRQRSIGSDQALKSIGATPISGSGFTYSSAGSADAESNRWPAVYETRPFSDRGEPSACKRGSCPGRLSRTRRT